MDEKWHTGVKLPAMGFYLYLDFKPCLQSSLGLLLTHEGQEDSPHRLTASQEGSFVPSSLRRWSSYFPHRHKILHVPFFAPACRANPCVISFPCRTFVKTIEPCIYCCGWWAHMVTLIQAEPKTKQEIGLTCCCSFHTFTFHGFSLRLVSHYPGES